MHKNINGDRAHFAVARALNELRCGRAIYFRHNGIAESSEPGILLASAETASTALLSRLEERADDVGVDLIISRQRALTLGLHTHGAQLDSQIESLTVRLQTPASLATVRLLAGVDTYLSPTRDTPHDSLHEHLFDQNIHISSSEAFATHLLTLAKQARLIPAMLTIPASSPLATEAIVEITASDIESLARRAGEDLERVSEAQVPLSGYEDCRLVLFRDRLDATEHVAIIIGSTHDTMSHDTVVPVRVHSACFTGDLLASLRCDCGDQLRGAVDELASVGGGVLLYLAQEGRGIGLANKLRAYELQDGGLNTIEADRHLGFNDDERSYAVAAAMLRHLAMTRVHLLTNNLEKIAALQAEGIDVVTDQRLTGSLNRHNARYLHAKREHAGHLLPDIQLEESL